MTRRERERLMRRREIMEAARTVFAEKGYIHATLDEIAQRAEYGKGTLYNYFAGGKEDILFAICDEIYDDLCQLIQDAFSPQTMATKPFRDAFHKLVTSWIDFFVERQELFMIVVKEAYRMTFSDDRDKAAYFHRQGERVVNVLIPPLESAMQAGVLRPLPPHSVAHMILGNLKGIQMHMCLHAGDDCREHTHGDPVPGSFEAAAAFLTTMLCDGLLAQSEPYLATNTLETSQEA